MLPKFPLLALAVAASMSAPLAPAFAADLRPMPVKAPPAPVPVPHPWTFDITPYAWALSLNGSSAIRGHPVDVDT